MLEPLLLAAPDDIRLLTLLGNAYVAVRRYEEATALFEKVATSNPDNSDIRTRLALTRLRSGDRESAIRDFESVLENDPDEVRANLLLVLTHVRQREFDKALKAAEELKRRLPDNPMPENFLGTVYLGKGDKDAARTHFAKALEIDPDFAPAAMNLAEMERADDNLEGARSKYQSILERNPKHQQAMLRMAQIAFAEKNDEAGIEWLEKAVTANPKSKGPRLTLVGALLRMKENERALNAARAMSSIAEKDAEAMDALARAQMANGKLANAVATYRQIAVLLPKSAIVQHRLGRTLAAAKNYSQAAAALDKAIALDGALILARQDRVQVAYLDKGPEEALSLARKMTEAAPDKTYGYLLQGDVQMRAGKYREASTAYAAAQQRSPSGQILSRQFRSLTRAGMLDEARALLETWLEKNPDDSATRFLYASALIRGGDIPAAIQENETLLKTFPENPILLNDLAWLYGEIKDERAIPYAQRAHNLAPESPEITDTLGWLLVQNGDTGQGLELLRKAHAGAPDQHDIGYHLAAALSRSGDDAEALKLLKDILDTGRPFAAIEKARTLYAALVKK